jgi:hypothetical protein
LPNAIETEKLNEVIDCAYLAPSKQGKFEYTLYVISNSVEGKALKEYMFWEDTFCLDNVRGKQGPGLRRYNGQVNAPVVLVWLANKKNPGLNVSTNENDSWRVRDDCIVSATMALCAAEAIGLQTGFCGCIDHLALASKITGTPINQLNQIAVVSLGIGYGYFEPGYQKSVYQDGVYPVAHPNTQLKLYPNAYQLLLNNKNFIISEVNAFISNNVNNATLGFSADLLKPLNVQKCERDCNLILGAFLHDLQFDLTDATTTTVSHYWNNGQLQVKRSMVEQAVYEYVRDIVLNYILVNRPLVPLQETVTQSIDTALTVEPRAVSLLTMLISIVLDGLKGEGILPIVGSDTSNALPSNRVFAARKNRPGKDVLVKYI